MKAKRNLAEVVTVLAVGAASLTMATTCAVAQTETVLFSFGAPPAPSRGGTYPFGKLVLDSKGSLYGTTLYGGHSDNCDGGDGQTSCGVAFQLAPKAGGSWTERVLHTFSNNGTDGTFPGPMVLDAAGNLYGTTGAGGPYGDGSPFFGGVAFELSPEAGGKWTEKILYSFEGGVGDGVGDSPGSALSLDAAGNLYGTTGSGGSDTGVHSLGCGSVYELTPGAGGNWAASPLHTFMDEDDGCGGSDLILSAEGNPVGSAGYGQFSYGVVFELTPGSSGAWMDSFLKEFNNDGPMNTTSLAVDAQGNLFGTSCDGAGLYKYGAVFELAPGATGVWTYSIPYTFKSTADGACPTGLVVDPAGSLYGVTEGGGTYNYGTAFKLVPASGGIWTKTILHSFAGGADGSSPTSLTLSERGDLYGTTVGGGAYSGGTVFKIVP